MEIQERYEIRRKLGQGGVGAVYEGYDHQLRRKVAVKRLLSGNDEGASQEMVDELLKECHSLSALNSPNIVSLFDFGQDSDGPFVVMELLEGETLETLIQRAPFTEADFLTIAEQSLEGILAAHEAHLLHRDLKPCNFMITWLPSGRMQLKVLDFGLAKFSVEPSKQTIAHGNSLFGSIYFMAPEQFEQLPLDGRTDLYSLGAVFYYALTGTYPFDGDSVAQVMAGHLTGRYKDLREYRPDVNPNLCNWIMSLMARQPDERPASCAIALEQFMGILRGTFVATEPNSLLSVTSPVTVRSNPDGYSTNTAAVRLNIPGSLNTSQIPFNTAQVPLPDQTATQWGENHPAVPTKKKSISKSVWYAVGGGVGLIVILLIAFSGPRDASKSNADAPENKVQPGKEKEEPGLPSGDELRRILSLPDNVIDLLARRDANGDGEITVEEFARFATSKKSDELLRKYFPLIDRNQDGALSSSELNRAYRSRG